MAVAAPSAGECCCAWTARARWSYVHRVSPEPTQVEIHRGVTPLVPFVQEWRLALNPEDLEEIAYEVLKHSHGPAVDEDDVGWRESTPRSADRSPRAPAATAH